MPEWWRTWFGPSYLAVYDAYLAERTPAEVDGLQTLAGLRPPMRVLDLGCGQGRHAIELARRGYTVSGLDLSAYLLDTARRRAQGEGLRVDFIEGDMRRPPPGPFDAVISLFTAFGYFEQDAENLAVLRAVHGSLSPGGRMVLEVINGERVLRTFEAREWVTVGELVVMEDRDLDRDRMRLNVKQRIIGGGFDEAREFSIRLYTGSGLEAMFEEAGYARVDVYNGWEGEPASAESVRLLAVASRDS
jgi:SAM-dependent methyltransferase